MIGFKAGEECLWPRRLTFSGAGMADGEGMTKDIGTSAGSSEGPAEGTTGEGIVSRWWKVWVGGEMSWGINESWIWTC